MLIIPPGSQGPTNTNVFSSSVLCEKETLIYVTNKERKDSDSYSSISPFC